jgi:hypothetical protein
MDWDEQKVLVNIRQADTDDLLDRVTAYRAGMEPDAIVMIEQELHRRGVTEATIEERAETCKRECLFAEDGTARTCDKCRKPAVREAMGWHKLFRLVPVFPKTLWLCKDHAPATQ